LWQWGSINIADVSSGEAETILMTSEPLLQLITIRKNFHGVPALRGVSLDLYAGEIHALVGENGAGKSTLMKLLSGSYPHGEYEGEIRIEGTPQAFDSPYDAEAAGIAMIYQELGLHLDMSIAENLHLGQWPRTPLRLVDWKAMDHAAREAMEWVGLTESPRTQVRSLSASLQQLVAIAKALLRRPRILILDEPTSMLTTSEAEKLMLLLKKLRGLGLACIYISHKLDEVQQLADRVTILRDGQNIATYQSIALERDQMVHDMVGRRMESLFPDRPQVIRPELLRIEHLTIPHPYTPAKNILEDVSFNLYGGEVLGLGGLVGSGRSELVNAIFGIQRANPEAAFFLNGERIAIRSPRDAIDAGMGLVTEDRKRNGFVCTMDIKQNITLASLERISRWGLVDPQLERTGVETYIDRLSIRTRGTDANILSLSGGNQQKVVLAKWLMRPLKVLLLDEPTRGIDIGAKAQIYELISTLAAQGMGIIMISSELTELLAMCDRFIVLAGGKIQDAFPRAAASSERVMQAATRI
jgi:ABC-type sugar transport system ATPase subunit